MNMSQKNTHSVKSEIRENLSISIPLIASQLIYSSSNFVGTAMVAHLGEYPLAASVLVSSIWWTLSVLFFGVLNSVSILVSHQFGARNDKAISEIMGQAFILSLIITVLLVLILFSMPFFLRWTGQPAEVLKLANEYTFSLLWTIPGLVILVLYEQFLAGINRAKIVLRISLLVVPIEIPLIYLLVFGKFGFPECGIAGIGYGFATTYTITTFGLIYYLVKSKQYHRFGIFDNLTKINMGYLKELIVIGLPMGFMHVVEVSTFAVATLWIAKFGTTMLAAHQIVMQYLGFAITIVFAMSQAVTVRVGHEAGRNDLLGVTYASYIGLMMNTVCVFLIAIFFYLTPNFFLSLDIDPHLAANASLANEAVSLLWIGGVLLVFDNFRIIGFGALRGLKDTHFSMYSAIFGFWLIGLTSAYIFAFVYHFSGQGIWWGLTLGIAVAALVVHYRLYYLLKRVDLTKLT